MDNEMVNDQSEIENSGLDEGALTATDTDSIELSEVVEEPGDEGTAEIFELNEADENGLHAADEVCELNDEEEADSGDESDADAASADDAGDMHKGKSGIKLVYPQYTKRLPFTLIAALIGALVGLLPSILCAFWFTTLFYPFYIAVPLFIYVLNMLLKGCRDFRSLIVNAVFSFASTYTGILACRVALVLSYYNQTQDMGYSLARLPALTIAAFRVPEILPTTASSYVYPLLFTLLGIAVIEELIRFSLKGNIAQSEAITEPELSSKFEIQNTEGCATDGDTASDACAETGTYSESGDAGHDAVDDADEVNVEPEVESGYPDGQDAADDVDSESGV